MNKFFMFKITLILCFLSLFVMAVAACNASGTEEDSTIPNLSDSLNESESSTESESMENEETYPESTSGTANSDETKTPEETEDYFESTKIETVQPDASKVIDAAVNGEGYDIYQLPEGESWGYRYDCTMLYNDDGSVDAYFACVGIEGEWDWISYRHSDDNGQTWSNEKIVLTPTRGSMDSLSCCDPGVVYFDGYYYLGYTSTLNVEGYCNNLYVARSENPDGPFEKWNGNGWGGDENVPIVYYDQEYTSWGIGEPSFVELNGTLYIYYTQNCPSGKYLMVATADAKNDNWPADIDFKGVAAKVNTDSLDIKYIEDWGKFIGVATGDRMNSSSWLAIFESNDGLTFELVDAVREGTYPALHNAGISSARNGHINLERDSDRLRVIYAYGTGWGQWNTRVQNITLKLSDGNDIELEKQKPCLDKDAEFAPVLTGDQLYSVMIRAEDDSFVLADEQDTLRIEVYLYDTYFSKRNIASDRDLVYIADDENVIELDRGRISVKNVGKTKVTIQYEGLENYFYVTVVDSEDYAPDSYKVVGFEPVRDEYVIVFAERALNKPQIRGRLFYESGEFAEIYTNKAESLENLGWRVENATFTGYDESIIEVSETGVVTAKKTGQTDVTVTSNGFSFDVHITVTDDIAQGIFVNASGEAEAPLDYASVDFSNPDYLDILSTNSSSVTAEDGAFRFTVTSNNSANMTDAFFSINYINSSKELLAENYKYLEITYMVPTDVSSSATNMQLFICCDEITSANAAYQIMVETVKDGEYHTLKIDMSELDYWKGIINMIRFDFFDASLKGDSMYVSSIRLVEK